MKQMRKLLSGILASALAASGMLFTGNVALAADGVAIDEQNFPDAMFRGYIEYWDIDKDNVLSPEEIASVDSLHISQNGVGSEMGSLKGIEYFYNLTVLDCDYYDLVEVDLSKNTNLEFLYCSHNKLTSLDLRNNTKLKFVRCNYNALTTLDVRNCSDLNAICILNNSGPVTVNITGTTIADVCTDYNLARDYYMGTRENSDSNYYEMNVDDNVRFEGAKFKMVPLDSENFPDDTFRKILSDEYDLNKDGNLELRELMSITNFDGVDLTGVESFEGIDYLEYLQEPVPTVEDFAERLYTTCLGRDSEEDGKNYWTSELKAGKTGAEVAEGFFFSTEYEDRKLGNEAFINTLYETFMDRKPADDEVNYWASEMKDGKTRKDIFDGFVNSPEWANICLTYGIRSGGLAAPTFEKEASEDVLVFAERLYTTCLGREAEKEGLEWWATELANLRQTGTLAAQGFFFSTEFLGLKTNDDEYVTRLYKTFMGREPESEGFEFWVGALKNGTSRQDVFDGFSGAPEFAELCSKAGIMR